MKLALILYGNAGCGKSNWIKQEAKNKNYKLFRWNVRNDRSLREGREILHLQVRSQEKTLIWIEGADDLTQEAQAFLRRILDTRSNDVNCVLEVRDPSKLSAPVLSRCSLQRISHVISYRKNVLEQKALYYNFPKSSTNFPTNLEELYKYKQDGNDPVILLLYLAKNSKNGNEALRRWSTGHSAWLQTGWLLSCG